MLTHVVMLEILNLTVSRILRLLQAKLAHRCKTDIPTYRTHVLYVPQRPSLLPGTPRDFIDVISSFSSRKKSKHNGRVFHTDLERAIGVAKAWGVDEELWDRNWSNLSGGEMQRIALAVAVGLDAAEIVLLDGASRYSHSDVSLII
jgi:ABC-type iron transport system FetAB ATPase subunit